MKTFQSELNKLRLELLNIFAPFIFVIGIICAFIDIFLCYCFYNYYAPVLKGLKNNSSLKPRGFIRGAIIQLDLNQRGLHETMKHKRKQWTIIYRVFEEGIYETTYETVNDTLNVKKLKNYLASLHDSDIKILEIKG